MWHRWNERPRKKTNLGESLAVSHAYNPIRDSGETLVQESRQSLAKSLAKSLTESLGESLGQTLGETLGKTLGETSRARQASPQSLGSDYMHGSPQDSLRDSFFHASDTLWKINNEVCEMILILTGCRFHLSSTTPEMNVSMILRGR